MQLKRRCQYQTPGGSAWCSIKMIDANLFEKKKEYETIRASHRVHILNFHMRNQSSLSMALSYSVLENFCFHNDRQSYRLLNVTPFLWSDTPTDEIKQADNCQNKMSWQPTSKQKFPAYFLSPNWHPWSSNTIPSIWQLFRRGWRCESFF
jgi:hypothetical protein